MMVMTSDVKTILSGYKNEFLSNILIASNSAGIWKNLVLFGLSVFLSILV